MLRKYVRILLIACCFTNNLNTKIKCDSKITNVVFKKENIIVGAFACFAAGQICYAGGREKVAKSCDISGYTEEGRAKRKPYLDEARKLQWAGNSFTAIALLWVTCKALLIFKNA